MTEKEMLIDLLGFFHYNEREIDPGFEWSFVEGTTVSELYPELNEALLKFSKENTISEI